MSQERVTIETRHWELLASVDENQKLVKRLRNDIRKAASDIDELEALLFRLGEIFSSMQDARIVLLTEYTTVRKLIPENKEYVAQRRKTLAQLKTTLSQAEALIERDKAEITALETKIRSWGEVIPFKPK